MFRRRKRTPGAGETGMSHKPLPLARDGNAASSVALAGREGTDIGFPWKPEGIVSMKHSVSTAALSLVLAAVAAPAMAQSGPVDWSGPYIGIFGGYQEPQDNANEYLVFDRDFDGDFNDPVRTSTGANAFSPGFCDGAALGTTPNDRCDPDGGGVEGGVRAGWDWQFGSWVVGGVAELTAVEQNDTVTGFSTTPAAYIMTRDLEHMAALRARVGYAAGPALVYATAGGAYGKVQNRFFTTNGANSFTERSGDDDADGYQFGGGVEWRLAPRLTLVGEYIYTDLDVDPYVVRAGPGTAGPTNPFILPPNTAGTDISRNGDSVRMHSFRLGMNVRF